MSHCHLPAGAAHLTPPAHSQPWGWLYSALLLPSLHEFCTLCRSPSTQAPRTPFPRGTPLAGRTEGYQASLCLWSGHVGRYPFCLRPLDLGAVPEDTSEVRLPAQGWAALRWALCPAAGGHWPCRSRGQQWGARGLELWLSTCSCLRVFSTVSVLLL